MTFKKPNGKVHSLGARGLEVSTSAACSHNISRPLQQELESETGRCRQLREAQQASAVITSHPACRVTGAILHIHSPTPPNAGATSVRL